MTVLYCKQASSEVMGKGNGRGTGDSTGNGMWEDRTAHDGPEVPTTQATRSGGHSEVADPGADEFVFELRGRRFAVSAKELEPSGKLHGTMLASLAAGPSSVMAQRDSDGVIALREEDLPDEVVDWLPDIVAYVQTGTWPRLVATLADRFACLSTHGFVMGAELPEADHGTIIFGDHLLDLPKDLSSPPTCSLLLQNGACVKEIENQFDAADPSGATVLRAGPTVVQLRQETGDIYAKLGSSMHASHMGSTPHLKNKFLKAALIRPFKPIRSHRSHRLQGGFLLFIHAAPYSACGAQTQLDVATWPSFWLVIRAIGDGTSSYHCDRLEVLPGVISCMADGSIVALTKYESLRDMLLHIYISDDGALHSPPLLVNPVAPQPPFDYRPSAGKGKGKGDRRRYPRISNVHPHGRSPAKILITRSITNGDLALLIHAQDGRVALAHRDGAGKTRPWHPWCPGSNDSTERWDVWRRGRFSDCKSRKRFAVPVGSEVIAVLPRLDEVVIARRLQPGDAAGIWRVPLSEPFVGNPEWLGKGGCRRGTTSSWSQHEWYGKGFSMPHQKDATCVCEAIAGSAEQPQYSFLRLNAAWASAADYLPSAEVAHLPVIIGSRTWSPAAQGCRGAPCFDRPRCATSPMALLGKSAAVASRTGRLVEQWHAHADI